MPTPPESALAEVVSPSSPGEPLALPAIEASDGELLRLFANSEHGEPAREAAFGRLVERHGGMVWRVCRQVLPVRQDAEDAFQATFLLLARRGRSIRASESAAGWLYRVAFRTAMAAKRRRKNKREQPLENEPPAPPESVMPDLVGRETTAVLMEELQDLPKQYRAPLVMRYLEGRSRREIAEETDATVAAVQGRLARGKALLRGRLLRRGVSLSAAMAVVAGSSAQAAEDPLPSSALVAQTTGNSMAISGGGSVAASTAVLTLYQEGVRVMFFAQAAKPLAALAIGAAAALSLLAPAVGDPGVEPREGALELQAEAPAEAEQQPAAEVSLAAEKTEHKNPGVAQPGTRVVVFGRAKPNYHTVSATGEYCLSGVVNHEGKLFLHIPGRPKGELGGYLDQTFGAPFDVRGKSPSEIKQALATWLKDNKISDAKDPWSKDPGPPVQVTVTRVEFAQEKPSGESSLVAYEAKDLPPEVVAWTDAVAGAFLDADPGADDAGVRVTYGTGGFEFLVSGSPEVHERMERALKNLTSDSSDQEETTQANEDPGATAEVGSRVVVKWKQLTKATNGSYMKSHTVENVVDADGVVPLRIAPHLSPGLLEPMPEVFVVRGKSTTEISREIKDYFAAQAKVKTEAHEVTVLPPGSESQESQVTEAVPTKTSKPTPATDAGGLAPGQRVTIEASGVSHGDPIEGLFRIERGGTVALGPIYGRVKIAGLDVVQAEAAIKKHLETMFSKPEVQVTEAAPEPSATRREPENGAVVEYWPDGSTRSERGYRDARLVTAVEYSENGQVLYEMTDDGTYKQAEAAKARKQAEEKLKPPVEPAATTDRQRLLELQKKLETAYRQLKRYGEDPENREPMNKLAHAIQAIDLRLGEETLKELKVDGLLEEAKEVLQAPARDQPDGSPSAGLD